ncbi:uncharacterized protein KY384_001223 [Bacidia gigantensis]|uniref:uncharacterized protein n=1 Tax=Bacidia gigantensis TaxID=2732470 RepID=UPI001D044AC3|nr:uncharacterized protein KY384_001223 [Bacidia gigantensis]KAG8534378.1 hypothetical protein KY384_001223 [Bacidia gigantensis]
MLTVIPHQATEILPPDPSSKVLDDGCGLGTVTAEVKKSFPDISVIAIDSSAGMLEVMNRKAKHHDWKNVETKLLDGGDLTDIPSASITHAFACTYIDLAHNATACILELSRVTAPSGIIGLTTWADPYHPAISLPWVQACRQLHPNFQPPLVTSPKWSTAAQIKKNLESAGFKDVETKQVKTHWHWSSAEEMVGWFFDGGNPVCGRWHEALREEGFGGEMGELREGMRRELEREYRSEGGRLVKEEMVNLTVARK